MCKEAITSPVVNISEKGVLITMTCIYIFTDTELVTNRLERTQLWAMIVEGNVTNNIGVVENNTKVIVLYKRFKVHIGALFLKMSYQKFYQSWD